MVINVKDKKDEVKVKNEPKDEKQQLKKYYKYETKKDFINKKINRIVNSAWFIVALAIVIFIKTIIFYFNTIAISEKIAVETLLGTLSFIVVIGCFLYVLPNKIRIVIGLIINASLSILLFSDNLYYNYSNSVLSIAQFTNLQYGDEIISTLPMLLEVKHILYFIDIVLILIIIMKGYIKVEKKLPSTKKQRISKYIVATTGLVIFSIIGVKYVEKGKEKSYNKDMQIREATILGYHIYDVQSTFNIKKQTKYKKYDDMITDYEKLKRDYKEKYGKDNYEFKGILANKNIIIVQLESIQEFVIGKTIDGKQITPNLNQFLDENIEIKNMYMQSYSTTADSEHSCITSIYPMENGMSFSKYYTNTYDDLFRIFNNANYDTSYMHGNDSRFWNRGNVYGKLMVNHVDLKDKFEDLEYINGFLSDEVLYNQAVPKIKKFNEPFISFIVSASSHTPFELEGLQDRNKVSIDVRKI